MVIIDNIVTPTIIEQFLTLQLILLFKTLWIMSFKLEVWISQQKKSIKFIIWPIEDNNVTKFTYTSIQFFYIELWCETKFNNNRMAYLIIKINQVFGYKAYCRQFCNTFEFKNHKNNKRPLKFPLYSAWLIWYYIHAINKVHEYSYHWFANCVTTKH